MLRMRIFRIHGSRPRHICRRTLDNTPGQGAVIRHQRGDHRRRSNPRGIYRISRHYVSIFLA